MTVMLGLQQLTTLVVRWQSCLVYNSWQHRRWDDSHARFTTTVVWGQVEQDAVLIVTHILFFETQTSPAAGSECGKIISNANFLTVFNSNYGSILLSFWDMAMGWTTDDRATTATITYQALRGPAITCWNYHILQLWQWKTVINNNQLWDLCVNREGCWILNYENR